MKKRLEVVTCGVNERAPGTPWAMHTVHRRRLPMRATCPRAGLLRLELRQPTLLAHLSVITTNLSISLDDTYLGVVGVETYTCHSGLRCNEQVI
jgi:hypothetical protein